MKLNDFLTMNKSHAIVLTVGEYPKIKDKICGFYTSKQLARLDEFCKESWSGKAFMLCNPYLTTQIITPLMLDNAVTFVDRTPLRKIKIEEEAERAFEEGCMNSQFDFSDGEIDSTDYWVEEDDDERHYHYTPSAENGDYSPSNPWDAPGMKISDFI